MTNELYEKYPSLKNRKNARLIRIKIAPINTPSKHIDGKVALTKDAAIQLINEKKLSHMPIHYGNKTHKREGKYIEIGHIINNGEIVLEDGMEFLEADVILHEESQKEYVDEIVNNTDLMGNSWELIPHSGYESNGVANIKEVSDFIGNAIMNKDYTAFDGTKIVYAAKSQEETPPQVNWEEEYKKVLVENQQLKENIQSLRDENIRLYDRISLETEKVILYSKIMEYWKNKDGNWKEEDNSISCVD